MNKKLLSIGEAAKFLGVSVDTLRQWDKKGILRCFRPSASSKRYYLTEEIKQFLIRDKNVAEIDPEEKAKNWAFSASPFSLFPDLYCETSDVFLARLQRLSAALESRQEIKDISALIVAIAGEIGNNSYNHNLGNWPDIPGIFFGYNLESRKIVLADRGQGIFQTLKRVVPDLKNHSEALKVAFTEYISGRAPESRGNGLKFVRDVVLANPLRLEFYSGDAKLELKEHDLTINILKTDQFFHGSLAIIHFNKII